MALAGGTKTYQPSAPGVARLRYSLIDIPKYKANNKVEEANVGFVEINVALDENGLSDQIEGLVNIEVNKDIRSQPVASRTLEAIMPNAKDGRLNIYDIKRKARKFWEKVGIQYETKGDKVSMLASDKKPKNGYITLKSFIPLALAVGLASEDNEAEASETDKLQRSMESDKTLEGPQ